MAWFMGIDIGFGSSKGVITENGKPRAYQLIPSRADYRLAASKLIDKLLLESGLSRQDIVSCITTGHDAGTSGQQASDIRCCARGINSLLPQVRTIIDIQGMSSQVIRLNEAGQVIGFAVSEKCAAGSGRFLETVANILRVELKDIGPLALRSENPVTFSTECAVFGESEVISRVAEGTAKEDILAGVHRALANKLSALASRTGLMEPCAISGGGGLDAGLIRSLEDKLELRLLVPAQPQFTNALGAAIIAEQEYKGALGSSGKIQTLRR